MRAPKLPAIALRRTSVIHKVNAIGVFDVAERSGIDVIHSAHAPLADPRLQASQKASAIETAALRSVPGKRITNSSPPCRPIVAEWRPATSSNASARVLRARSPALCWYLSFRPRKASISRRSEQIGCPKRRVSPKISKMRRSRSVQQSSSPSILADLTSSTCFKLYPRKRFPYADRKIQPIKTVGAAEIEKRSARPRQPPTRLEQVSSRATIAAFPLRATNKLLSLPCVMSLRAAHGVR